jgi:hypothetical protein
VMLRFRNRFKPMPSELHTCRCGKRLTRTVADGREMIIHELPWCDLFAAFVEDLEGKPGVEAHFAMAQVRAGAIETVVIADGDRASDVQPSSPGRPN